MKSTTQSTRHLGKVAGVCIIAGAIVLGAAPAQWLFHSWFNKAYDSHGVYAAGVVAGLFLWSVSSRRTAPSAHVQGSLLLLLGATLIRALGQVLEINIIGATVLAVDVYALGRLAGVHNRVRAVSPGWLAVVFLFALPIERMVQRLMGFALQHVSAAGAGRMLTLLFDHIKTEGVRIIVNGQDVLVDLPCSGARGVTLLLLLFATCMAFRRPTALRALACFSVTVGAALLSNMLRITILATGIRAPHLFGGIDVMLQPWHDIVGLAILGVGAAPILFWPCSALARPAVEDAPAAPLESTPFQFRAGHAALAGGFLGAALLAVHLPQRPVDISRHPSPLHAPRIINGFVGAPALLLPHEKNYFSKYGGRAVKMQYGPMGLLLVRSSAPLRHLHEPGECLRSLGYKVESLGVRHTPLPSTHYRLIAPDDTVWRLAVSFTPVAGHPDNKRIVAANVSEAVWRWFSRPKSSWLAVQRLAPWDMPVAEFTHWSVAAASALDITLPPLPEASDSPVLQKTNTTSQI